MATTYGRPYFRFSRALNRLGLQFDSILPEEIPGYAGHVVFTTVRESPEKSGAHLVCEEVFDLHPTLIRGMLVRTLCNRRLEAPHLVLGVDPGKRLGLSVSYCGTEIEISIHSTVGGLVDHMIEILGGLGAARKTVKIGNGEMRIAEEIGAALNLGCRSAFELHLVDERGTSPRIKNCNQGGRRDMLSARFISRRDGFARHAVPQSMTG